MSMFGGFKQIQNLTQNGDFAPPAGLAIFTDFACFLTPPLKGRISKTNGDLFTKLGQCATEASC